MPKLYELLAAEQSVKSQAEKVRTELAHTFEKKTHLFTEKVVTFTPFEEGAAAVTESQIDINTDVPKDLRWISEFLIRNIDTGYFVAEANTKARADVILEGAAAPLISNVPVTALLALAKRCAELQAFVVTIPTLDPAKSFQPDAGKGAGIYKARDARTVRTKKIQRAMTIAKATDKHQEQAQLITEDVPVGELLTQEWSGLLTVAAKGLMLERIEILTRAVKKARARANEQELPKAAAPIGDALVNYVFWGPQ